MEICKECGKPCGTMIIEVGIGGFECWGERGIDNRTEEVSDCCEAEIRDMEDAEYSEMIEELKTEREAS